MLALRAAGPSPGRKPGGSEFFLRRRSLPVGLARLLLAAPHAQVVVPYLEGQPPGTLPQLDIARTVSGLPPPARDPICIEQRMSAPVLAGQSSPGRRRCQRPSAPRSRCPGTGLLSCPGRLRSGDRLHSAATPGARLPSRSRRTPASAITRIALPTPQRLGRAPDRPHRGAGDDAASRRPGCRRG